MAAFMQHQPARARQPAGLVRGWSQIGSNCHSGGVKSAEQCSDTELLFAARVSADAFGVFYERHVASVLAFFRRRVPGPDEAFDLTAETFAAALASVPRFEPGPEPPRAWLFAIARHKLSEALRSRRIQDEARRALAMEPIQLDDEAIEIVETTARGGAVELLETLGPAQRDAIKAHHLEERGYAEIAAELRCSESVIRKRVSRGLAALQAELRNGEA
jgi:RNA polymerase sigma factor (sigma-70 family)